MIKCFGSCLHAMFHFCYTLLARGVLQSKESELSCYSNPITGTQDLSGKKWRSVVPLTEARTKSATEVHILSLLSTPCLNLAHFLFLVNASHSCSPVLCTPICYILQLYQLWPAWNPATAAIALCQKHSWTMLHLNALSTHLPHLVQSGK